VAQIRWLLLKIPYGIFGKLCKTTNDADRIW
jgi:hypothetical protein